MCFVFAYCAEKFFGIAAITGAYMAGLMLSGLDDTSFVDRKVVVSGYMIFTPMFFAYIGISADFSSFTLHGLLFALVFVALGIAGKIIGCGGMARLFGFTGRESATVGCGMIARGEVALAVYATGQSLICRNGDTVTGIDPLVADDLADCHFIHPLSRPPQGHVPRLRCCRKRRKSPRGQDPLGGYR